MNKYQFVEPLKAVSEDPSRSQPSGLAGGYRGDVPPHAAPLDSSPSMEAIRFENGAIRRDFGLRRIGSPATSRVLALVEHKYIADGQTFERLVRLSRGGDSKLKLEVLTGGEWQLIETSLEDVEDVYLSTQSIQGVLLIADGKHLWIWKESRETDVREDDFPTGNSLVAVDDTAVSSVGAEPMDSSLKVGFSISIEGTSSGGITAVVGIERNGAEFAERIFVAPADLTPGATESWAAQQYAYEVAGLANGDSIALRLKSINAVGVSEHVQDSTVSLVLSKTQGESEGDDYEISFDLDISPETAPGDGIHIELQYSVASSGPFTYLDEHDYPAGPLGTSYPGEGFSVNIAGMVIGSRFRLVVTQLSANPVVGTVSNLVVDYDLPPITPVSVAVHGLNKVIDADAFAGLNVQTSIDNVSTLEVVTGAPAARFVYGMADYAIALRNGGDTQTFSWSVNGDVEDWTAVDSGQIFLVSAESDPIDDLMGFSALGSSIGALFRKRSIMRTILTGNIDQSIGAISWIEELGTEFSFSIQGVPGGIIFLASDFYLYFLNEQGPTRISGPIHQDLVRTLTSNLHLVDSSYDAIFKEYILGIPENGASTITRLWIFDLAAFHSEQKIIWRTRALQVQRFGRASAL